MKKLSIIITGICSLALFLSSCSPETTMQKDCKYMGVRFRPLTRSDFTLVGNLQCEATLTGKQKAVGKIPDKEYGSKNVKKGKVTDYSAVQMTYFAPGPGEAITGSLYDSEVFNYVSTNTSNTGKKKLTFGMWFLKNFFPSYYVMRQQKANQDWGLELAYYTLVAKYPEVDYFINVRFDRKTVFKGKRYSETIIVRADGVKLRTD